MQLAKFLPFFPHSSPTRYQDDANTPVSDTKLCTYIQGNFHSIDFWKEIPFFHEYSHSQTRHLRMSELFRLLTTRNFSKFWLI